MLPGAAKKHELCCLFVSAGDILSVSTNQSKRTVMRHSLTHDVQAILDGSISDRGQARRILSEFLDALEQGLIRAAEPREDGSWVVNMWVKQAILKCFAFADMSDLTPPGGGQPFFDKDLLHLQAMTLSNGVRVVPGGSSIRRGAHVAGGVICMPPMYINIGAWVGRGTMVDSHALVGTCAQIGERVHLSAAAQVGGVLEPAGARPVIIEDDVMVGGNCGVYEGVMVRKRAVLGSGVVLTASTKLYDTVNNTILSSTPERPLEVPEGAVVIAGSRALKSDFGVQHGLSLYTPIIVKYRDEKTDARTALESALRS